MASTDDNSPTIRALERGLDVIRFFTDRERPASIADVATATGLDRAVARRVLNTLEKRSYVALVDGGYVLQPAVLELGYAYLSSDPLPSIADSRLRPLARQLQESCSLGVFTAGRVLYLSTAQFKRIAGVSLTVGTMATPFHTSIGRMLLASLSESDLAIAMEAFEVTVETPFTITDPQQLRTELARVRNQGWCLTEQETELGLLALAVPVRDSTGTVRAAINATTHTSRSDPARFVEQALPELLSTASSIEKDLRHIRSH